MLDLADRAAALNINWSTIATTLYDAFGPQLASTIYSPTNQYRVLLEMLPNYQRSTDGLRMIYLKSDTGQLVPLNAVAKLVENAGPQSIPHSGQLPSVTLSFALKPGTSLGEATDQVDQAAKDNLPATISGVFQGTAKVFQDSMRNMGVLLVLAIAVVYIVLGVLYEKLRASADDSFRACRRQAFGAAAHFDPVQGGPQHLLFRRDDHADRHRKEKRHHADRFRARSRAQGKESRQHGGDLRGMPDSFPTRS